VVKAQKELSCTFTPIYFHGMVLDSLSTRAILTFQGHAALKTLNCKYKYVNSLYFKLWTFL